MTACTADPSGQGISEDLLLNMSVVAAALWRCGLSMCFIGKFMNAQLGWEIQSSRISLSAEAFHSGSLMKVWEVDALDAVCDSNECFEIPNPDFVSHHGKQLVKRANTVLPVKKKQKKHHLSD